jgi:hypothetical protein
MITIITTGRDDDYGNGFLDRLKKSMIHKKSYLEKNNIDYEYIVSEWNPIRNFISENFEFIDIFKNKKVKNVIALPSVSEKENLSTSVFFEYFAKNLGARMASNDILLFLNSDIIVSDECFDNIKELIKNGLDKNHFYRARYRGQYDNELNLITVEDCHYPNNPDAVICGYCSGDFLLIHKDTFYNVAKGYDETNPSHRVSFQSGMDGEILWTLNNKGVTLKFIEEKYFHINHGHPNNVDGVYNTIPYNNKENWGFIDYERDNIKQNVTIIK